jgi:AraC family transcriptional regulator
MSGMLMEMTQPSRLSTSLTAEPSETTEPPGRIVRHEQKWCVLPRDDSGESFEPRVAASRWTGFASQAREEMSVIDADCPVLAIALRPMDITVFEGQRLVHDGRMQQGVMRVNEPGQPMRGIFRGRYDSLHLHIPNAVLADCLESGFGESQTGAGSLFCPQPIIDPVIEQLAHALIRADDFGGSFGQSYADGLGLAIVSRLLGRGADGRTSVGGPRVSALSKWRLKRAVEYITAHLSEPIGLADIAACTGLTRMHFAAQFRVATGLRPHEYLVRRRVERAQELLATSRLPLVEIALEVGFKTQSHFTTVFARVVGETPNVWRRENCANVRYVRLTQRPSDHPTALPMSPP